MIDRGTELRRYEAAQGRMELPMGGKRGEDMAGHWACPACGAVVPDAERHECAGTVWDQATADRITGVLVATAEWEATQAVVAAARDSYRWWADRETWQRLGAALARLDGPGKEDER